MCTWDCRETLRRVRGRCSAVRGALRLRMWNAAAVKRPAVEGGSKPHRWYSEDDGTDSLTPKKIAWVELRGPMDCTIYTQAKWNGAARRWLGPDPLNGDWSGDSLLTKVRKSKKPIGALLMDQSVTAGVGNIYRAELLYRARLSPFVAGKDVPEETLKAIWKDAVPLMKAGHGGPADCDYAREGPAVV